MTHSLNTGMVAALAAAALFVAGTPFAKLFLAHTSPWLLAGLLYLGSGTGLWLLRRLRRARRVHMAHAELGWLAGAIIFGGMAGPVLLMFGLSTMPKACSPPSLRGSPSRKTSTAALRLACSLSSPGRRC